MAKLYLTGGNGYVGKYLVPALLKESYTLKLLLYGEKSNQFNNFDRIEFVNGDIRDKKLLMKTVKGSDAVIHLGAIVGSYNVNKNIEINYVGTRNLIEVCKSHGINRFIFISSVSATRKAQGPYGKSKKLAEDAIISSGLDYTILRPTTIMGRESLGLNRIIENVNRFNFFIPMVGFGYHTRHPVYILDFINLIVKSINNQNTFKKVYEIGGENIIYIRDLVKLVNEKLGNKNKIIIPIPKLFVYLAAFFIERFFSTPPFTREHVNALGENTSMNTTMIKEDLNFHPISMNKMLDIVLEEIRNNPPDLL